MPELHSRELAALAGARTRLGTRALASALQIPAPSLRRMLSTGRAGPARIEVVREYTGVRPHSGVELGAEELGELAEMWGVDDADVEDLFEELDSVEAGELTGSDLREYIDALYDSLIEQGFEDLDVSDLWDMYFGYEPGAK